MQDCCISCALTMEIPESCLTHCGLVTPFGSIDLCQHWLRKWLVAWRHQAITWTNYVDSSAIRSSGIHLRAISQEILPQPPFTKVSLKITYRKLNRNLPGANELKLLPHLPGLNELMIIVCRSHKIHSQWPLVDDLATERPSHHHGDQPYRGWQGK